MSITKSDKNTQTTGRPTLNEVARRAGVDPITALRALHGAASATEELAQKVHGVAHELDYVTNPAACALASVQSHSMAVLVSSPANLLFIETLETIHMVLRPRGLEVLIGNFHYSRNEEGDLIHSYPAYQSRGLLLTGFGRAESARRMIETSDVLCVYMMDLDSDTGLNCTGLSQLCTGEAVAECLLARGRRCLAYTGTQLDQRTLLRGRGFHRILQKTDCHDPRLEIPTPRPSSVALDGELSMWSLAGQPQVDGMFFCSDNPIQDVLLETLRRGVKIPEQIVVLGFNDLPGSDCMVPRLSSIRIPREAIGRRAVEQLLALIAGKKVCDNVLDMGFELTARGST